MVGRAEKRRDRQRSIHMTLRLRGSNRTWQKKSDPLLHVLRCTVTQTLFFQTKKLFNDGGSYNIKTSPLISRANQLTGFYVIGTSVMKQVNVKVVM